MTWKQKLKHEHDFSGNQLIMVQETMTASRLLAVLLPWNGASKSNITRRTSRPSCVGFLRWLRVGKKVQKYGPLTAGRPSGGQERSQKSSLTFQVSVVASEDWKLVPGAWLLSCKQRWGMVFWKTLVLHSASQSIGLSEVWSCHLCNSTGVSAA